MSRHPQRIQSVHVESMDAELCVYDTARQRVHSLNRTAAFIWQRCDGGTAPADLAAALSAEASIDDAEAVVRVTLQELEAVQLLEGPIDELPHVSRRDLLRRGVAAAAVPAIYSIVAPPPAAAQSGPLPDAPTLTSVSPDDGFRGTTVPVTLTGTNFVVGATTVTVNSGGVTASNVVVSSATSLTADIVITAAAVAGAHTVKVKTAGGTSGPQTFTVSLPPHGSTTFDYTGGPESFTVPAGVVSILIEAVGAGGGQGVDTVRAAPSGEPGKPGRAVARVSVAPGAVLTARVGGKGGLGTGGSTAAGGFNGGGGSTGDGGGGGGGATSVHDGATPLVIAGGGGGGGSVANGDGAKGGNGGGLNAASGQTFLGGGGGGGGRQSIGGAGGTRGNVTATAGSAGTSGTGGAGGSNQPGVLGGGGGGGGYFGGGGGGGGTPGSGGGGGGSSFTAPGATNVVHQQGSSFGTLLIISW